LVALKLGYELNNPWNKSEQRQEIFLSKNVQTSSVFHPMTYLVGTRAY